MGIKTFVIVGLPIIVMTCLLGVALWFCFPEECNKYLNIPRIQQRPQVIIQEVPVIVHQVPLPEQPPNYQQTIAEV